MQYDVSAATVTGTGAVTAGRNRIKALSYVGGATAGAIVLTDGNGGSTVLNLATPANGYAYMLLPGEGILCANGIYAGTLTNITSLTVFYG